jgi:phosphoribosyl 1,2-cyclic phosphodiesterase
MRIHSLFSSSSGNSCLISTDKISILIDLGVSYKRLKEAMGDVEPEAVFITHEHGDHISGAGVFGRKTGKSIYLPERCFMEKQASFNKCDVIYHEAGTSTTLEDLKITSFSTKHDVADSVGYVIEDLSNGKKFGYLTDTGSFTRLIRHSLKGCDAYLLEADYDTETLWGHHEYDIILKGRIDGPYGHLSNAQVLDFIDEDLDLDSVEWLMFGHLSSKTNNEELLLSEANTRFPEHKDLFRIAPTKEPLLL